MCPCEICMKADLRGATPYARRMAANNTQAVFDLTAGGYNTDRAKLIPGFADFYSTALKLVPANAKNVLDLGAGTGLLTSFLRERLPFAHLHLIDNADRMLAQSKKRFVDDPHISFQLDDYTTAALGGPYDAIASALSIHHLDDDAKRPLFHRLYEALARGGVFINADQILAPTADAETAARARWLADVRAAGATEQQIADSLLRQREDRCATVESQLKWLREAGFIEVDCPYAQGRFAVLFGRRP